MRIIVDGFGGDNAPVEILKGCAQAVKELDVDITVTGPRDQLEKAIADNSIDMTRIDIAECADIMTMHDEPTSILKKFSDSSMAKGLKMVAADEGDAFITAGSTGAFVVGSTFITKRMKGIKRPALATIIPGADHPYFLIDIGANAECRPEMLVQFALMGDAYMRNIYGVENPTVALANIGIEETKGGTLQQEAYKLLQNAPLNFVGNIEPYDIPYGKYDVVVCDGFTGNIILKLTEGLAKAFSGQIKGIFLKNLKTKLAYLAVKSGVKDFKKRMDSSEHGGAPLLGVANPVFKAHGNANAKAIKNAIRMAKTFVEKDVNGQIKEKIEVMKQQKEEE